MFESCKFVDEVYIEDKYVLDVSVLKKYNADYILHGDDLVKDENGNDIYSPF